MAFAAQTVTIKTAYANGDVGVQGAPGSDQVAAVTTADTDAAAAKTALVTVQSGGTDFTALDAAMGVLVADGETPTQAHVTTANSAWTTFKADQATAKTAVDLVKTDTAAALAAMGADVTVIFDPAKVVTMNAMHAALKAVLQALDGSGTLTR